MPDYKVTEIQLPDQPELVWLLLEILGRGPATVQALIDQCQAAGHDGRLAAGEIGQLLLDGAAKPLSPTQRISGDTMIRKANVQ